MSEISIILQFFSLAHSHACLLFMCECVSFLFIYFVLSLLFVHRHNRVKWRKRNGIALHRIGYTNGKSYVKIYNCTRALCFQPQLKRFPSLCPALVFQRLVDVYGIENHISQEPSCFSSIAFAQYKAEKKHFLPLKTKQTAMNVMKIDTNCWSVYGLNGKR